MQGTKNSYYLFSLLVIFGLIVFHFFGSMVRYLVIGFSIYLVL